MPDIHYGFEVNTLTVVATEAYEQFAENLQKEIEYDTGIRFGIAERHQFAAVPVVGADGRASPLGFTQSEALWEHLRQAGYLDSKGKLQDTLRLALKQGTLAVSTKCWRLSCRESDPVDVEPPGG